MPTSDPRQLATVAEELVARVEYLGHHLEISQRQVRRMRVLTWLTASLAALAVLGGAVSVYLLQEVRDTAAATEEAQIQSCRNANETREAQVRLWSFVIDVSSADGGESPAQLRALEQLRTWVVQLFAPRDCSDLSKEYEVPDPPDLLGAER